MASRTRPADSPGMTHSVSSVSRVAGTLRNMRVATLVAGISRGFRLKASEKTRMSSGATSGMMLAKNGATRLRVRMHGSCRIR